ncbi:MAG: methyltransferase domain-containing protein [Planctomycetes bacterium]|nr:methyltransferase domain-containing protein [Planctomycetota bacterium]
MNKTQIQRFGCFVLSCAAALTLFTSCASTVATPEVSVRPGINQPYIEDQSVERWRGRFEIESREIWSERTKIVQCLGELKGKTLADVGAGTGFLARMFTGAVGPEGRVIAVDILPSFLEHMRTEAAREKLANFTVVEGAERSCNLAPASCDMVFSSDTYHHFEYPRSMNASVLTALKPGGHYVVLDFVREEGQSRKWILDHVRAGEPIVRAEIEAAGFEFLRAERFLKENYILFFRKQSH